VHIFNFLQEKTSVKAARSGVGLAFRCFLFLRFIPVLLCMSCNIVWALFPRARTPGDV
jgi:hypothetical protein